MMNRYPWHNKQWQQVESAIAANRLAHALLLKGEQGVGKLAFTKALAKQLLCQHQNACKACQSCHWFAKETHPDFYTMTPESLIKIDDIRALTPFLQQTSHSQHGAKVILIALAENMNQAAANALLKALEEPTKKTYFLLISENAWRLLPTIKSRCQLIDFPITYQTETMQWLQAQGYSQTLAKEALILSGGRPLLALSILEDEQYFEYLQALIQDMNELLHTKRFLPDIHKKWQSKEVDTFINQLNFLISLLMSAQYCQGIITKKLKVPALLFQDMSNNKQKWHDIYYHLLEIRRMLVSGYNLNKTLIIDQVVKEFL